MLYSSCLLSLAFTVSATVVSHPGYNALPIVDLGYVRQQARQYNATGKYYTFSNIRYAQAPVGKLRWEKAARPKSTGWPPKITDGGDAERKCPNAWPNWFAETYLHVPGVPIDPTASEDCLFLDVTTPKAAFEQRERHGAPVLVWIHGGGAVLGSKNLGSDPSVLVTRARQRAEREGFVFVALNYRIGIFGTLNSPDFQKQGGVSNAGLLDQRFALDWVQEHICRFGGDPNRVTVMGESSAAAGILNHLSAYGGTAKAPFRQAIIQSPTSGPALSDDVNNEIYGQFLEVAGVKDLAGLRKLSNKALIDLNQKFISESPFGTFGTGGVWALDGSYVTEPINVLLQQGKFDKSVKAVVGFNTLEGSVFSPNVSASPDFNFRDYVENYIFGISTSELDHVVNKLYPAAKPGRTIYKNEQERVWTFTGELLTYCYAVTLNAAYRGKTHSYLFPGEHTDDTPYVFYHGETMDPTPHSSVTNVSLALELQDIVIDFTTSGNPNGRGVPRFPRYGRRERVLELATGKIRHDPHAGVRCDYLQSHF